MGEDEKIAGVGKKWIVLFSVATVTAIVVIVGLRISGGFIDKSRLSATTQTVKSVSDVIAVCQINNYPVALPDDAKNPQNAPCFQANQYPTLDRNATKDCIYNTQFVPTVSDRIIENGAIQAGCGCNGNSISTCAEVFQCDFATTGKCTSNNVLK